MVLGLEDAVTILSKWKDDSAHVLVVSESPFQQSRRGIVEQGIDWALGLQGKVSKVSVNPDTKGKKRERLCFGRPAVPCRSPLAVVPLATKNREKPSQFYEKKLSLRPSRHSLCSFRQKVAEKAAHFVYPDHQHRHEQKRKSAVFSGPK
jgi:hypothetical protein